MKSNNFKEKMGKWFSFWEPFILSKKMDFIYDTLKKDSKKNNIFPVSTDTFNAFKLCDPKNLKVVIIGSEPYTTKYKSNNLPKSDGLFLSCSNSKNRIEPKLEHFLNGIAHDYDLTCQYSNNLDLSYLAEQGVLLLNRALTSKEEIIGGHIGLWDEFIKFFLENLEKYSPNSPVVLIGEKAHYLQKYITEENPVILLPEIEEAWDTNRAFEIVNTILRVHFEVAIKWLKTTWDDFQVNLTSDDPEEVRISKLKDDSYLPF